MRKFVAHPTTSVKAFTNPRDMINNPESESDIDQFRPDEKTMSKLMDYRAAGSKVNVRAIKSMDKLLTYYYGGKLMNWEELCDDIFNLFPYGHEGDRICNLISQSVKPEAKYQDTRSKDDIALGIGDSKGLFTFSDRARKQRSGKPNIWLPTKLLKYFITNDIPVRFEGRSSGSMYDTNGLQWSEIEHLTLYPDTPKQIKYDIVVHTNEGDSPTTYSGKGTRLRTSIQEVINDIARVIKIYNAD